MPSWLGAAPVTGPPWWKRSGKGPVSPSAREMFLNASSRRGRGSDGDRGHAARPSFAASARWCSSKATRDRAASARISFDCAIARLSCALRDLASARSRCLRASSAATTAASRARVAASPAASAAPRCVLASRRLISAKPARPSAASAIAAAIARRERWRAVEARRLARMNSWCSSVAMPAFGGLRSIQRSAASRSVPRSVAAGRFPCSLQRPASSPRGVCSRTQPRSVVSACSSAAKAASLSSASVQRIQFSSERARGASPSAIGRMTIGMTRFPSRALVRSSQVQNVDEAEFGAHREHDRVGRRDQRFEPRLPRLSRRDVRKVQERVEPPAFQALHQHSGEGDILARIGDEYFGERSRLRGARPLILILRADGCRRKTKMDQPRRPPLSLKIERETTRRERQSHFVHAARSHLCHGRPCGGHPGSVGRRRSKRDGRRRDEASRRSLTRRPSARRLSRRTGRASHARRRVLRVSVFLFDINPLKNIAD